MNNNEYNQLNVDLKAKIEKQLCTVEGVPQVTIEDIIPFRLEQTDNGIKVHFYIYTKDPVDSFQKNFYKDSIILKEDNMKKLIFDKKDVFTALNREEAEIYVGEKGYYCYRMHEWMPCELLKIHFDEDYDVRNVFTILDHKTELECPMFLPADKVKIPKTEYRPFKSLEEFLKEYPLGSTITYKKNDIDSVWTTIVTGVVKGAFSDFIQLSNRELRFTDMLFDDYKILKDNKWIPFGTKVEVKVI